jgi:hypothetical protein
MALRSFLFSLLLVAPLVPPLAAANLTVKEAEERVAVAMRLIEGGIYDQAADIAREVLNDPSLRQSADVSDPSIQAVLALREAARFALERARFGTAPDRETFEDIGDEFALLYQNRYRLNEPRYGMQSAYWAGRSYQEAEDYERAVAMYTRVGGINLPQNMEGDAARRTSESLRDMAEAIPYPGTQADRQRRERLLDQAINELERARLAFPIGRIRKELELDLIALRLARRQIDYVREAMSEADAFLAGEAAKDDLRARAALYRGMAAERLDNIEDAIKWFRSVVTEENPTPDDKRNASLALALALRELSGRKSPAEKPVLLGQAVGAFQVALEGTNDSERWNRARVLQADTLLELGQPNAALEVLQPILDGTAILPAAWRLAGRAELNRGKLQEALEYLFPATLPSNGSSVLRLDALREASLAANSRGDYGLALALAHHASRILRAGRVYSSLLTNEFIAMETLLNLGRAGGPKFLAGDLELLRSTDGNVVLTHEDRQKSSSRALAVAMGELFRTGGDFDSAYATSVRAEAATAWARAGIEDLEVAAGMIRHLRNRRPSTVTESDLLSREGETYYALALARALDVLENPEPSEEEIHRVMSNFTMAASSFRSASSDGLSGMNSLELGIVNLASGGFLLNLSERWERGTWSMRADGWRSEALSRIEASIRPFDQALTRYGPVGLQSMRARWSKSRALEFLQEWRPAASGYSWLMNNSEAPRVMRVNAARHWAHCMTQLGESALAVSRLAGFAQSDAGAAFIVGQLSEQLGDLGSAYRYYLFAADPESPVLPPVASGMRQEAAYNAAKLALNSPEIVSPGSDPEELRRQSRELLATTALDDIDGTWTVRILEELADSWINEEPEGWRTAHRLAVQTAANPNAGGDLKRAMYILGARALKAGGNFAAALDELDRAYELVERATSTVERRDAARVVTLMADIYREQGRYEDALRAYANVFATYPEAVEEADAARASAARMILLRPGAGQKEDEQVRAILSGLRNQNLADEILNSMR